MFYRTKGWITLMVFGGALVCALASFCPVSAQEESSESGFESLMDDVAYPPPAKEGQNAAPVRASMPKLPNPPAPAKKKWWQREPRQPRPTAAAEEAIVNVGPRETAASSDLLFRLPLPVRLNDQALPSGFYLVKPSANTENEKRELVIYKENKRLGAISVFAKGSENPKTPVRAIDPKHPSPPLVAVEARVAEDQKSLTVVFKEGDKRFLSDPLTTQLETRPELNF